MVRCSSRRSTTDGLTDGVAYRNSKGEFWTSTVADILTHVVLHAAYHRGQIAAAVREAGGSRPTPISFTPCAWD